jgi:hypothetical protein
MGFINYTKLYIHKSCLFAIGLLYFNFQAGFSGTKCYDDLAYALYKVATTVVAIYFYMLYD